LTLRRPSAARLCLRRLGSIILTASEALLPLLPLLIASLRCRRRLLFAFGHLIISSLLKRDIDDLRPFSK